MNAILRPIPNTPIRSFASDIDQAKLFAAIDADPAFVGAGVVYIGSDLHVTTLRVSTNLQR